MFASQNLKFSLFLGLLFLSSVSWGVEMAQGGVNSATQMVAEEPPWPPNPPIEGAVDNSEMSYTAFDTPAPAACNEPKVYAVVDGVPDPNQPVTLSESVSVNPTMGLWDLVTGEDQKTQILFRVAADGRGIVEWQSMVRPDGVVPRIAFVILHSKAAPEASERTRVYWFSKLDRSGVPSDHNELAPGLLSKISFCYTASQDEGTASSAATGWLEPLLPVSTAQAATVGATCTCQKRTSGCFWSCNRKPCQCL